MAELNFTGIFPRYDSPAHRSESTFLKDGLALSRFLAILITLRRHSRRVPMTSRKCHSPKNCCHDEVLMVPGIIRTTRKIPMLKYASTSQDQTKLYNRDKT